MTFILGHRLLTCNVCDREGNMLSNMQKERLHGIIYIIVLLANIHKCVAM